ncbi:MAG: hypothetical protein AAGD00_00185 [Planctomycetota bacterium]
MKRHAIDSGKAALWASAFVIGAMLISQAGSLGESPAMAQSGNVSNIRDLVVLTANASNGEDVLMILDGRDEQLYVYGVSGNRSLELFEVQDVGEMFAQGRGNAGGGRRR